MGMLKESDRKTVAERLSGLSDPVKMVVFTQEMECMFCRETRELIEEVGDLSDKIVVEVYDFVADKAKAMAEYVRVTKPGGHVGLNEVTWLKTPSPELVRYVSFIMRGADFLRADQWRNLLEEANLEEVLYRGQVSRN